MNHIRKNSDEFLGRVISSFFCPAGLLKRDIHALSSGRGWKSSKHKTEEQVSTPLNKDSPSSEKSAITLVL